MGQSWKVKEQHSSKPALHPPITLWPCQSHQQGHRFEEGGGGIEEERVSQRKR